VVSPAESPGFRNEILAVLPAGELERIRPHLLPVSLTLTQILHEAEAPVDEVFFLEFGLVSLTADTKDIGQVEVGMTGREGFIGLTALLNPEPVSVHRAMVQVPGRAHRIRSSTFRELLETSPALRDRCLRYIQVMLVQNSQIAACNARHSLPQRLARRLLMSRDRVDADDLPMTQELLSYVLGVRRAGISVVANALQSQGLIRQSRGRITVVDRAGLEKKTCSCYRMIERSQLRVMETPALPGKSAA